MHDEAAIPTRISTKVDGLGYRERAHRSDELRSRYAMLARSCVEIVSYGCCVAARVGE